MWWISNSGFKAKETGTCEHVSQDFHPLVRFMMAECEIKPLRGTLSSWGAVSGSITPGWLTLLSELIIVQHLDCVPQL